jgi:transposase
MEANETLEAKLEDMRPQRGLAIVQTKGKRIKQIVAHTYLVPSQTNDSGGYVVNITESTCTCPDFEERGLRCKHQWAVLIVRHDVTMPDGSVAVTEHKITYSQDWPAYNKAQVEEKERVQILLRGLCDGIVMPKQTNGRPRLCLADVVYGATMKVYSTFSGRRASTDIRDCEKKGFIDHAPAYNSLFRYMEQPSLEPLLTKLVEESAIPLEPIETTFAADATGFSTNTYTRWFDEKYGKDKKEQRWVKAHAMVGTLTNIVTTIRVTESNVGDSTMFKPLLASTAANDFNMKEVSADKAYLSNGNLTAIENVGAVPYIPMKSNSTKSGFTDAWERLWHFISLNRKEFLAHYHKRSNVESTFSTIKRKFGASVRSKVPTAQYNEVLLKVLCHNLSMLVHAIHELGIEPKFWMPTELAS